MSRAVTEQGELYLCLTPCDTRCLWLQTRPAWPWSLAGMWRWAPLAELCVQVAHVPCHNFRNGCAPALCAGVLARAACGLLSAWLLPCVCGVDRAGWTSPPTLIPRGGLLLHSPRSTSAQSSKLLKPSSVRASLSSGCCVDTF